MKSRIGIIVTALALLGVVAGLYTSADPTTVVSTAGSLIWD